MSITQVIQQESGLYQINLTTFRTTVREDSFKALTLENMEPLEKYHWIRSKLNPSNVDIKKIDTKEKKVVILLRD